MITMRLVCDNYMIHFPCLSYTNIVTTPIPLAEDRLKIQVKEDIHFVHFRYFYKMYKVPKMYEMYPSIY